MFLFARFPPYTCHRWHTVVWGLCHWSEVGAPSVRVHVPVVWWNTLSHCWQHCKKKLQKNSIWMRDAEVDLVTARRAETSRHLGNYDCYSPLGTDVVPRSSSWWWRWEELWQKQSQITNKASWQWLKMKVYFCWCHDSNRADDGWGSWFKILFFGFHVESVTNKIFFLWQTG